MALIRSNPVLRKVSPAATRMALAKLGERKMERLIIRASRKMTDPEKKHGRRENLALWARPRP